MQVGAEDASRYSAESEAAMRSMERLLGLSRRMETTVASSALLANVELANIEELILKLEVYKVFMGISQLRPEALPDETQCRLGQWYYDGEGREHFSRLPGYAALDPTTTMALALFLAVLLNQKTRGERVFRMSFYLPVILGFNTAVLLCWRLMLNTGTGIINQLWRAVASFPPIGYLLRGLIYVQEVFSAFFLGVNTGKFNLLTKVVEAGFPAANRVPLWVQSPMWTKMSVILLMVWGCGAMMLIFLAGLNNIPRELHEAAEVDGASGWQRFWKISFPLLTPYIFYNLVYALVSFPIGMLADRIGLKTILIAGLVLFAVVYAGFSFAATLPVFLSLFFLYGIYAAATEGISKALITNIARPADTATAIGFYTGFASLFTLAASSLAGFLWFALGPAVMFLVSAAGAGSVALFFFVYFIVKK